MIAIKVVGSPAPQGSKSFKGIRGGKAILAESSKAVKPWREAVVWAAREAMAGCQAPAISGPVEAVMVFTLPKPKSALKTRQTWPDRKPDLDKVCRSTFDALKTAGVIEDDARIVTLWTRKVYPRTHLDALDVPGAVIRVYAVGEIA